jgi:hypothetical protein
MRSNFFKPETELKPVTPIDVDKLSGDCQFLESWKGYINFFNLTYKKSELKNSQELSELRTATLDYMVAHSSLSLACEPDGAPNYNDEWRELDKQEVALLRLQESFNVYHRALNTVVYAIEIGSAVPAFSMNLTKIISSYNEDCRFFSDERTIKPYSGELFDREVLKNVLENLIKDERTLKIDKDAMRALKISLEQKKTLNEFMHNDLKELNISQDLRKFLQNLECEFVPNINICYIRKAL